MGECEEDDVLDGAAMAGAVEGAARWCRVAHLAGGGDVVATRLMKISYKRIRP